MYGLNSSCIALTAYNLILSFVFAASLEAAGLKEPEQKIGALEQENSRLRQELNMEKEASKLLGQKLLKAYEEKVVLEHELKDKEKKIEMLEEDLAGIRKLMEKEIASYKKKLHNFHTEAKQFPGESPITGKISSVSKKFKFVIIEFGDTSAVKAGNVLSVFRGEKAVGKVEVNKIRKKGVSARIVETAPGEEIKEGDNVR